MTSNNPNLEALRAEAERLSALLLREVPKHARTHQRLSLEPDAPSGIKTLWEAIGWSDAFDKYGLLSPDLVSSEKRIEERLADYRSWGEGFSLTGADLPARRRVIEDDGQGVRFLITDEMSAHFDAPIIAVLADKNAIKAASSSYLRWCGNILARCAFSRWYRTQVSVTPNDAFAEQGRTPYPLLAPAVRMLTSDTYCVPSDIDSLVTSPHKKGKYNLAHRSIGSLVAFLETVELDSFVFDSPPSDCLGCPISPELVLRDDDRIRWLPTLPERRVGVGRFAGEPAIFVEAKSQTRIYVNPRNIERLKPIRDERVKQ